MVHVKPCLFAPTDALHHLNLEDVMHQCSVIESYIIIPSMLI